MTVTLAVGVVTCARPRLLKVTLASLGNKGFERVVIDNSPRGKLPAAGFARAMEEALALGTDVVMLSPDDFRYRPGWLRSFQAFWDAAPRAVALAGSCLLPVFDYSLPYGGLEVNGVKALLRTGTIAAWSFRREDAELVRIEVAEWGWEKAVCRRVMEAGRLIVELDLAEHVGHDGSSLGHRWDKAAPVEPYVRRWMR